MKKNQPHLKGLTKDFVWVNVQLPHVTCYLALEHGAYGLKQKKFYELSGDRYLRTAEPDHYYLPMEFIR